MARKRKRKVLNWAPILWLLFIVNTALGLKFSAAMSLRIVRVIGADRKDEKRIPGILQSHQGISVNNLPYSTIAEEILRKPSVSTLSFETNLLGRGLLRISYEKPVAILTSNSQIALMRSGEIAPYIGTSPTVKIRLYPNAYDANATICLGFESKKIAEVCLMVAEAKIPSPTVEVAEEGSITIHSGGKGKVALGSPDNLERKFKLLSEIRSQDPSVLSYANEIVLVQPEAPAIRRAEQIP